MNASIKNLLNISLCLLFCSAVCLADAPFAIDCNFPGGNVKVDSISPAADGVDYLAKVRPDLRDTQGDWFYYAFRVNGAEGLTVRFFFDHGSRVGARGPAISSDGGATWRYLSDKPGFDSQKFTYSFGKDEKSVLFATAILYTQSNWEKFMAAYRSRADVSLETLCQSRKGRNVELLQIGKQNDSARFGIALTCRHHCCEMSASFVLEGILQEVFSDSATGKWLRENCRFYVVPFVDKDGVEDGDQGKNRKPHDHNRDYNHEIHPEVKALKAGIVEAFGNKKLVFMDLHCPWIREGMNEWVYFPGAKAPNTVEPLKKFSLLLEEQQKDRTLPYKESFNLPFGQGWNNDANYIKLEKGVQTAGSKMWAASLPNSVLVAGLEMPYSNASGAEVNQKSAQEFGHSMAEVFAKFLQEIK